jgi:hypothetical protein
MCPFMALSFLGGIAEAIAVATPIVGAGLAAMYTIILGCVAVTAMFTGRRWWNIMMNPPIYLWPVSLPAAWVGIVAALAVMQTIQ